MNKVEATLDLHLESHEFLNLDDTFKGYVSSPFLEEIKALKAIINHGTLVQLYCGEDCRRGYIQKIARPEIIGKQTYLRYLVRLVD